MTRLIAISRKLSAGGYDVRTIVKNRVKKTAIGLPVVGMPSPVVYLDDILKYKSEESDESIIKFVKEELSKPPAGFPQSFAEDILAADSLKNSIYVEVYGAACRFFNKDLQRKIAKSFGTDSIILLPSSIHKCLVLPYTNKEDLSAMSSMVSSVNLEAIEPEEILGGKAIKIDCEA